MGGASIQKLQIRSRARHALHISGHHARKNGRAAHSRGLAELSQSVLGCSSAGAEDKGRGVWRARGELDAFARAGLQGGMRAAAAASAAGLGSPEQLRIVAPSDRQRPDLGQQRLCLLQRRLHAHIPDGAVLGGHLFQAPAGQRGVGRG